MKFARTLEMRGRSIDLSYEVKVVDGKLVGKIITPRGEREFTGVRAEGGTPAASAGKSEFVGKWDLQLDFQGQQVDVVLAITKADDGSLSGTWTGPRGEGELKEVTIADETLKFARDVERQGQEFTLNFTAKIVDGKLDGTMETPIGEMKFTGTKSEQDEAENGGRGAQMMARLDSNGDGKISQEEAPDRMQQFFDQIDTNADGSIDREELAAMLQFIGSQRGNQ